MVTSSASRTPSLFTSSSSSSAAASASATTVAEAVIAFLLLTSIGRASCSPTQFHNHRNISTIDDDLRRLPSPSSHSASAVDESLHLILQHRKVRRGSGSGDNTPKFACYSCTYYSKDDYTTGSECNDPINSENVPEVMCSSSCHKLQEKLHLGGVMLVRGCLPDCQEKVDEHSYRHCCQSKLCNHSVSLNSVNNAVKLICSSVLSLFLAARLNSFV